VCFQLRKRRESRLNARLTLEPVMDSRLHKVKHLYLKLFIAKKADTRLHSSNNLRHKQIENSFTLKIEISNIKNFDEFPLNFFFHLILFISVMEIFFNSVEDYET